MPPDRIPPMRNHVGPCNLRTCRTYHVSDEVDQYVLVLHVGGFNLDPREGSINLLLDVRKTV